MDSITPKKSGYRAYLLRIWSEQVKGSEPVWRFVLLDTRTGKQHGFRSLKALTDYLTALIQA